MRGSRGSTQLATLAALALLHAGCGCGDSEKKHVDAGDGDAGPTDAGDDDGAPEDAGTDSGGEFERYCGDESWDDRLVPATVGELDEQYLGFYPLDGLPVGTLETMKLVPEHPFQLTTIRLAYTGEAGPIRVRLVHSFGRSYPDLDSPDTDLVVPIEQEVRGRNPEDWVEVDVTDQRVFLHPTQHYVLVNERLEGGPFLALERIGEGEYSRALILVPGESMPYGSEGNFRMELAGNYFCTWDEAERWFGEDLTQPFVDDASARAAFADLDGDGHDDLVTNSGGPHAYFGDGRGGFSVPEFDPFPDARAASMLLFGDVDNDGDVDAFAATYVGWDDDGDRVAKLEGDCDDTDPDVNPRESEVAGNGKDDDCDGTADDGTDVSDGDEDGWDIASGDCNDNRDDVHPEAEELRDGRDNDCDGSADEDHVNRILLNDGTGHFTELPDSGVEVLDHSTAAGFGDGNEDGALDVYWGNWLEHYPDDPAVQDRYFEGNGDGTFVDAQEAAGLVLPTPLSCYGVMWNDFDDDGHQDIFVGNYHLYANQLWRNRGDGTFVDVAEEVGVAYDDVGSPYPQWPGGHTYGGDFGDVDNDGDMDFYMANLAHPRVQPWSDPSMFVVNQGPPGHSFVNRREEYGFIYDEGDVNAAFADYDNDMDVDIAIASLYTGHYSRLYRNDGEAGFTDVTYETNTAVHDAVSAVWSDVDEDGDPDLVIADRAGTSNVHLFINRVGQERNWIELVLEGTTTNRGAVGARVTLDAGGVTQMRDVSGGGGHSNTQSSRVVHFGLGDVADIDEVTVRWVGGGTESISGLAPNDRYLVVEGTGEGTPIP